MKFVVPNPAYIYHIDNEDDTQNDLWDFNESGAVDISEIYPSGKCELCIRLYTKDNIKNVLDQVALMIEQEYANWDNERPLRICAEQVYKMIELVERKG